MIMCKFHKHIAINDEKKVGCSASGGTMEVCDVTRKTTFEEFCKMIRLKGRGDQFTGDGNGC